MAAFEDVALNPVLRSLSAVEAAAAKVSARHRQHLVYLGVDAAPEADRRHIFAYHVALLADELAELAEAVEAARRVAAEVRERVSRDAQAV